jgi:hypothetical protein
LEKRTEQVLPGSQTDGEEGERAAVSKGKKWPNNVYTYS